MDTVQSNSERLPAGNSTGVAKYSPSKVGCGIGNFVRRFFKFTTVKVDDNKKILNKKSLYRILSPNVGRVRAFAAAFLGIGGSGAFSKARERESNRDVLLKGLKIDGGELTEILNQLYTMLKDSLDLCRTERYLGC
ncbi:MAG: hypothetical protein KDK40_00835 [Chlamydiia bacterium]|nr:hypothetical protein [Chlamydiia bacterium]